MMNAMADAFAHHPELRDKIADPSTSFFRNFRAADILAQRPELAEAFGLLHSDVDREASRREALAGRGAGDLWVFAYGSLMWDPAFRFSEVRRARVPDYARQFILKDSYGARGTRDAPGLMAALDKGDGCEGLLFRISAADVDAETEVLWRREMVGPAYLPAFVTAVMDDQVTPALTFVADHQAEAISPTLTHDEQVLFIATGVGFLGSSFDYLAKINRQLTTLGIVDEYCSTLLRDIELYRRSR
jgi:cation transport protein ChaC